MVPALRALVSVLLVVDVADRGGVISVYCIGVFNLGLPVTSSNSYTIIIWLS